MSRWYRAYEGTTTDSKLAEVALIASCSRSVAIASWHAILESCAGMQDGGRFDVTARRVAAALGEPVATIEAVFAGLVDVAMITDGRAANWTRRQFESDSSTERSRKHREGKRNGDATLQQQDATPPDTDTQTETERDNPLPQNSEPRGHGFSEKEVSLFVEQFPALDIPKQLRDLSRWCDQKRILIESERRTAIAKRLRVKQAEAEGVREQRVAATGPPIVVSSELTARFQRRRHA